MARQESDREDLLREATALVERAELQVTGFAEPVVVGFRRDGAASIFFGSDPVYQFNTANELRRAYVGGLLYKADRGSLIELQRERTQKETALIRRDLREDETGGFLSTMHESLARLADAMTRRACSIRGQWPHDRDVAGRIGRWIGALPQSIKIADAANLHRSKY